MLPEFLPGRCARLLAVRHAPAPGVALRGAVLCFVPFAEEMNVAAERRALAARRLAEVPAAPSPTRRWCG